MTRQGDQAMNGGSEFSMSTGRQQQYSSNNEHLERSTRALEGSEEKKLEVGAARWRDAQRAFPSLS